MIPPDDIQTAFAAMRYRHDKRLTSDRQQAKLFLVGWEEAVRQPRAYSEHDLELLTWRNLGYRFCLHFGDHSSEEMRQAFEIVSIFCSPPAVYEPSVSLPVPSPQSYAAAFRNVGNIAPRHIRMLQAHYNAPERTVTARELAAAVGYSSYSTVNLQYGGLARLVGRTLDYQPTVDYIGTFVRFQKRQGEWHWIMREEVAEALELLRWVEKVTPLPEEVIESYSIVEGAVTRILVNAYERNPKGRQKCIAHYGAVCTICHFDFGQVYDEVAYGFIHVHHLVPLSAIGNEYAVDPIQDLRPVCPNCHAVLHRRNPPYSIEEVQEFIKQQIRT